MQKLFRSIVIFALAALLLFGCLGSDGQEANSIHVSSETFENVTVSTPDIQEVTIFTEQEKTPIPQETTFTPSDDPTEGSDTPEPTNTPEPNPYVGVWTIEDLPFSIELRDDKTYLITVSEEEKEGTYTFDTTGVMLTAEDGSAVELRYYAKADTLKIDDFKMIRDDLVFYFDIGGIPVSFQTENEDLSVATRGAVVEAKAKNGKEIGAYCFTVKGIYPVDDSRDWFGPEEFGRSSETLRVFKYDGDYTLWTRDENGEMLAPIDVTVTSGYRYPIEGDGIDYLHAPLRRFLRDRGTGIDELNRMISRNVSAAGIYTRAGVVTAGVSLVNALSKYGYSVGYQENGSYQKEQDWGVNPVWGAKLGESEEQDDEEVETVDSYAGMSSSACIVWAYKQAGMNLCADAKTDIGTLGERENMHDNTIDQDRAVSGDIIKQNGQHLMVIDRLDCDADGADDAYLTYGMISPVLTIGILPFTEIQGKEVYSMDAFFSDTGRCTWKVRFWGDTFRIPADAFPMYLKETIQSEQSQTDFMMLLKKLGF